MIERLIRASLAKPLLVVLLLTAAAAAGGDALLRLRRDVFPDLSTPVFNVIVQNPAMAAEELESTVAVRLEAALAGLPNTRRIRSVSQLGVCQVTIEFEPDADYFRSRQFVAERMQQVAGTLPAGTQPPLLSSLTGRLNEIMELTIEAEPGAADLMTLRDFAEFELRNRLLAVPGIAAVETLGGYLRQFQVQLDPDRMVARGVTLDAVRHALEGANENAAAGIVTQGPMEWSVRAIGRANAASEIGAVVVALRGPTPILISDVADVREAPAPRRGIAHRLDGEIVSCRVVKQFGADTVRVARDVRAALAELTRSLPRGMSVRIAYDQAELVDAALRGVGRAVLIGAGFVVLVLLLLLGDLRAALIVTLTLPLSIALSGLWLERANVGLNTLTLGGLAIAVGLLVDASVIVVENIAQRIVGSANDSERRERALAAAVEVARPVAFTTSIVIAVFLPLFGMTGLEARMYEPLAAAVVAALLASLALALTFTPVAASWALRPSRDPHHGEVWLLRVIKRAYRPALDFCLRHAGAVRALSLLITLPALALGLSIGSDFMPKLDEGALLLQTVLPAEASLEQVDRSNHRVEDLLRSFPEVVDVVRRTGRSERTEDPMPHTVSDVLVLLKPERTRSLEALTAAMRERVRNVPGVTVLFTTPLAMRIDEGLGGTPADISIRVFGPDLERLATLGERVRVLAADVRGIADLRVEQTSGLPQLRVAVDRPALARVGLTPGDVVHALRVGMVGEVVSEVLRGQRRYDLIVRLQDDRRQDANAIRSLLIDGHDGTRIPLGQVATVEQSFGPSALRREAGSRRIAIEASVVGRDLGSTARDLRRKLASELRLPQGYFVDISGRVESQARASRSLTVAIALALVAVFLLLYLALDSLADTLVVLATLPDALVGGVLALYVSGETWNVSSLVGLIGLFGIAVQNGLVLITQTRVLVRTGMPFESALREASVGRVRPKLLTAATAILGLLPLLLLHLHGTEIERPLAIVMVGGLFTSTLFTLLALPTFYAWVHKLRGR